MSDEDPVATPKYPPMAPVMGTVSPPYRGGLMPYTDTIGTKQIIVSTVISLRD